MIMLQLELNQDVFLNQTKSAAIAILLNLIAAKLGLVDPYRLLTRVWSTRKHAIPLIYTSVHFLISFYTSALFEGIHVFIEKF